MVVNNIFLIVCASSAKTMFTVAAYFVCFFLISWRENENDLFIVKKIHIQKFIQISQMNIRYSVKWTWISWIWCKTLAFSYTSDHLPSFLSPTCFLELSFSVFVFIICMMNKCKTHKFQAVHIKTSMGKVMPNIIQEPFKKSYWTCVQCIISFHNICWPRNMRFLLFILKHARTKQFFFLLFLFCSSLRSPHLIKLFCHCYETRSHSLCSQKKRTEKPSFIDFGCSTNIQAFWYALKIYCIMFTVSTRINFNFICEFVYSVLSLQAQLTKHGLL